VTAKTDGIIPGNGTFRVGSDIKPGLYKTVGTISYWERLSGFTGEAKDILANMNPKGPDLVEIKDTDAAFRTKGSGQWMFVDSHYIPSHLTEFGDGTYMVGKDIEPGIYQSDGSVTYWERLSGFSGDRSEIITNNNPKGPDIVEIKPTDKGFRTVGGTWKKLK
jgi:hypothetical protein